MYTLFQDRVVSSKGVLTFPLYEYARQGLSRSLATVVAYQQRNARAVPSDHLLVKILQSLNVPLSLDVNIYRDWVEDAAEPLSMALRLTSSLYPGTVHAPGVLWGSGSDEIWVSVQGKPDFQALTTGWRTLQPVRLLSHPHSDLGLQVPMGQPTSTSSGLTVVSVDIPMLACQYRMWRKWQSVVNPEAELTVAHFVAQYPLTNALYSKLDIAVFNRLSRLHAGVEPSVELGKAPYHLIDYTQQVDKSLQGFLLSLSRRPVDWDNLLTSWRPVTAKTLRDLFQNPETVYTRQVTWALTVARIDVVGFLLQYRKQVGGNLNQMEVNTVRKSLRALQGDQGLYSALRGPALRMVQEDLKQKIWPYL